MTFEELKLQRRWTMWILDKNPLTGKTGKTPKRAGDYKNASIDKPGDWAVFEAAKKYAERIAKSESEKGVNIALNGDGLWAIDIDGEHCVGGAHNPLESEVLELFKDAYAESSPSGTGAHILFTADEKRLPADYESVYLLKNPKNDLECYGKRHFMSFTGKRISENDEIVDQTEQLMIFLDKYMKRPIAPATVAPAPPNAPDTLPYAEINRRLDLARKSKNGENFKRLFDFGSLDNHGGDHSAADLALCSTLAFWLSGDRTAIDRAFRASKLMRPKWDERHKGEITYGQMTIDKAILELKDVYKPASERQGSISPLNLPPIENLSRILKSPPPLQEELIEGVLRVGHKLLISGPSKSGKSFMLLELCAAIASGGEWLGFKCKKGRVLYVNMELDPPECAKRFNAVFEALNVPEEARANVDVWNLRGHSRPLDALLSAFLERVRDVDAVILDPIYKLLTGDENSARDMAQFVELIDIIASETRASVIYCHHHSKGAQSQKKSMDRASGSGVFARDPDALMDMCLIDTSKLALNYIPLGATPLRCEFVLRAFKPQAPRNLFFSYPLHHLDQVGKLKSCPILDGSPRLSPEIRQAREEEKQAAIEAIRAAKKQKYLEAFESVQVNGKAELSAMAKELTMCEKTVLCNAAKYGFSHPARTSYITRGAS